MSGGEFLMWMHLCAMASYVGAQFAVIYMLIPAAETAPNEAARRASLIAGFKFYNPFTIGVLGIIVISGAMRLTDLKASMKFDYFARIGSALELKLGLAFVLIFIQTYITFGLAFRIGAPGRGGRTRRRRGVHRRAAELDAAANPRDGVVHDRAGRRGHLGVAHDGRARGGRPRRVALSARAISCAHRDIGTRCIEMLATRVMT